METKHLIVVGALGALTAACSSESDLHWMPPYGYVKPAKTAPVGTVTTIGDLNGSYAEATTIDGTTTTGTATITAKEGSKNVLLLTGFMGRTEPLDLMIDMEKGTVQLVSEMWYEHFTILNNDVATELIATGTFDEHGVITITGWNVYDTNTFQPLYTACSTTLTKQWQ